MRVSAARSWPAGLQPELAGEASRVSFCRPIPHYALPQDRTPLWSERDRPGRFTSPRNPYKQSLDLAPKLRQAANRFSSPAQYGKASLLLPGSFSSDSRWSRGPGQQAGGGLEPRRLAPLRSSDLAHANALKQVSIDHKQQVHSSAPYLCSITSGLFIIAAPIAAATSRLTAGLSLTCRASSCHQSTTVLKPLACLEVHPHPSHTAGVSSGWLRIGSPRTPPRMTPLHTPSTSTGSPLQHWHCRRHPRLQTVTLQLQSQLELKVRIGRVEHLRRT